jgi:hypothetical protein
MNEHDENLRDLAAMFAMCGLVMRNGPDASTLRQSFQLADEFMSERLNNGQGIVAIKPVKKKNDLQK